jgi:hypothetical protein
MFFDKTDSYSNTTIFINVKNNNLITNKINLQVREICEKIISEKFENKDIEIFIQFLKKEKVYSLVRDNFNLSVIQDIVPFIYFSTLYESYTKGRTCPAYIYGPFRDVSHKWNEFLAKIIQKEIEKSNLCITL